MHGDNLKQRGPDMIEFDYLNEKENVIKKFNEFLIKKLMSVQKMSNKEAESVVLFLKSYEDYYKYYYDYDLFPNENYLVKKN